MALSYLIGLAILQAMTTRADAPVVLENEHLHSGVLRPGRNHYAVCSTSRGRSN